MSLKQDLVERFRVLHHRKYNENIEYQDAEERLKELAELVRLLAPAYEEYEDKLREEEASRDE